MHNTEPSQVRQPSACLLSLFARICASSVTLLWQGADAPCTEKIAKPLKQRGISDPRARAPLDGKTLFVNS
jgi:hypothetical protein